MRNTNTTHEHVHWGHFGVVLAAMVLVLGMSWMENPKLFDLKKAPAVSDANVPHYVAYVPSAEDQQAMVLGDSTGTPADQGPMIINDDGSISPVNAGEVLGANTQDVVLPLDQIAVKTIPDSPAAIQKYFSDSAAIENGPLDNGDFEAALSSGDQTQINAQAQKLIDIRDNLSKQPTPQSLVQLQKLTIAQYNAGIGLLQNFTQADQNPELVGQYLDSFLKSQQDLDNENVAIAQQLGSLDPYAAAYVDSNGNPLSTSSDASLANSPLMSDTSSLSPQDGSADSQSINDLLNSDGSNDGQ